MLLLTSPGFEVNSSVSAAVKWVSAPNNMDNWIEQLEGRRFLSASVSLGTLTVSGTASADRIIITQNKKFVLVREGSHLTRFNQFTRISHISHVIVNALGGNDRIKVTSKLNATIDGGEGNDLIQAGAGSDVLLGGNGNDKLFGGGGNDSIAGGDGRDVLFGGAGDDQLDAADGKRDNVAGGRGKDSATVDVGVDVGWNVEDYLSVSTQTTQSAAGNLAVTFSGACLSNLGSNLNSGMLHLGSSAANLNVNSGMLNLGNAPSNLILDVNSGSQHLDLINTSSGFHSVTVYSSSLSAAKTALFSAVVNANVAGAANPLNGIVDSNLRSSGTNAIGIAQLGNSIIIRPTRIGDLNLDGTVTISDFIDLSSNFNTGATWQEGTLNYDQNVTISDFIDLASNFNSSYVGQFANSVGAAGTITFNSTIDLGSVSGDYVLIDYASTPLTDVSTLNTNSTALISALTKTGPEVHVVLNVQSPSDLTEPVSAS
jgi:hypothetical protein